jgi:putative ABC transport system permease protein
LAIGANTAIFSVVNAAFLRPLPYPGANRLVFLWLGEAGQSTTYTFSYPRYEMFRKQATAFDGIAAYDDEAITFSGSGEPERIEGGRVSANFFSVMGVRPAIGRTI